MFQTSFFEKSFKKEFFWELEPNQIVINCINFSLALSVYIYELAKGNVNDDSLKKPNLLLIICLTPVFELVPPKKKEKYKVKLEQRGFYSTIAVNLVAIQGLSTNQHTNYDLL